MLSAGCLPKKLMQRGGECAEVRACFLARRGLEERLGTRQAVQTQLRLSLVAWEDWVNSTTRGSIAC